MKGKRYSVIEEDLEFFTRFKIATVEADTTIAEVLRQQARQWLAQHEAGKQQQQQNQQISKVMVDSNH